MNTRSTLFRLMAAGLAIVFLCVGLLFGLAVWSIRDNEIAALTSALTTQAEDIGALAAAEAVGRVPAIRTLLSDKARKLYEAYDAYLLIVDKYGNVVSYMLTILDENRELRGSFDSAFIADNLVRVLTGETVAVTSTSAQAPMFTVAVPIRDAGSVIGAVYIQTAEQNIRNAYRPLAARIGAGAGVILAVAALVMWLVNRYLTDPLRAMASAAESWARGRFDARIEGRGTREMRELSQAFNGMADSLERVEQTRRDFLANVSHELKSPLTGMHGFVSGMLDGTISEGDRDRYLLIVRDETTRLTALVNQLLSLSKMEGGTMQMTVFDAHECIRRVMAVLSARMESKSQTLRLDFSDEPLNVRADRDAVEQVLTNLVDNAIKYTPSGGTIAISTERGEKRHTVCVSDDGIGISAEDAPHIFERFYMADKAHTAGQGTGLGLAITKQIIDNHGESIWLIPSDKGARIAFTLAAA